MAILTIEAHCVDDEFRAELTRLGVKIIDNRKAPWEWVFEGPKHVLHYLLSVHWHITDGEDRGYITGD